MMKPHLYVALTEIYDIKGFPHSLPVSLIVDGAHFGTIPLKTGGIT